MTPPELLIAAHAENFIADGTVMGRLAHELYYASRHWKFDPCEPKLFNSGFPFRVWRDSGAGYAMGRNRPEYSIDGQAKTAAAAVAMAGNSGVIVTADNKSACLHCGKPGGDSVVRHPKTAGIQKGRYHSACVLKAKKQSAKSK